MEQAMVTIWNFVKSVEEYQQLRDKTYNELLKEMPNAEQGIKMILLEFDTSPFLTFQFLERKSTIGSNQHACKLYLDTLIANYPTVFAAFTRAS